VISLVIVSHSAKLAEGVAELARSMGGEELAIGIAGGLDGPGEALGTDPLKVLQAIDQVYSEEGVLILMDLGSAVLSAEMALELMPPDRRANVMLCEAPIVEGAVVAAAQIRAGSSLTRVASEALRALTAKITHLRGPVEPQPKSSSDEQGSGGGTENQLVIRLRVQNRVGLHARPAARFVQTLQPFELDNVQVRDLTTGGGPVNARSITSVIALNVRQGHEILVSASGSEAGVALDALCKLVAANFGDQEEE
jgi:phosphocarrier protein FPr